MRTTDPGAGAPLGRGGRAAPYGGTRRRSHRANPLGLLVTALGVAGFTVSVFLDWLGIGRSGVGDTGPGTRTVNGYDLEVVIPLLALLGIGLLLAMLYAYGKAAHGQHRGLTLTSMAVGLAATGLAACYLKRPPGTGGNTGLHVKYGVVVALASAAVWALGSGLHAAQTEGDHHDGHHEGHGDGYGEGYGEHEALGYAPGYAGADPVRPAHGTTVTTSAPVTTGYGDGTTGPGYGDGATATRGR